MSLIQSIFDFIPTCAAMDTQFSRYQSMKFSHFAKTIELLFHNDITLRNVLTILFTLLINPGMLALHFRQQIRWTPSETSATQTPWMNYLAISLYQHLKSNQAL